MHMDKHKRGVACVRCCRYPAIGDKFPYDIYISNSIVLRVSLNVKTLTSYLELANFTLKRLKLI